MPEQRMSRVDTAWLRMDTAANRMAILGVWLIAPTLDLAALRERLAGRLLKYPRFRQKVVEDALGASWVDDDAFDIGRHVVAERLARRRGESAHAALQRRVAELAVEPLDAAHPLWQLRLVEDLGDGRSALISRIHHCIGDGIALISVMLSMTDGGRPPKRPRVASRDGHDWISDALIRPATELAVKAIDWGGEGVAKSVGMLANPAQPIDDAVGLARSGWQLVGDALAIALMPDDSPTRLKGRARPDKRVAWGEPLPLDAVKAVGRAFDCSVNDVLLAAVTGAIGGYLRAKGDDTAGQEIRAMVPVNLRPLDDAHELGNRFGLVPLVLPIGITNPIERLYAVRARMRELKGSYQPIVAFGVLAMGGLLVKPVQTALMGYFARKATAVMTNVPGPQQPLGLCGRRVEQVMFWVPQTGDIGMGVSILSYAGGVQFGLITDRRMCPDPQAIIDRFRPEFEQLLWLALMLPWEPEAT